MSEQKQLLELKQRPANESEAPPPVPLVQLQLRRPDRRQVTFAAIEVEQLVGAAHPVRAIWELTAQLDLSRFSAALVTRRELAVRPAWDPRLLVAIWIWACSEGVSSAREIERQSSYRPELQWLCGMEIVNHHSLSDFRVAQADALEEIFTQVLALLSQEGLVDLAQVAVDDTRVRSQGATSSARRRAEVAEFSNAWLKERSGLMWALLAYNAQPGRGRGLKTP